MQLIDQNSKRVLAWNLGTAGGKEQAIPFVIVHKRQDRTILFSDSMPDRFWRDRCEVVSLLSMPSPGAMIIIPEA